MQDRQRSGPQTGNSLIIRSRAVVTMAGPPIENGAVAIAGNRIAGVGRFEEVKADHRGDVLDLGEQIILPGLINAHCHLDYTVLRDQIHPQPSFTGWIQAINASKSRLSEEDYIASISEGFVELLRGGSTTVLNLEAFPGLLPRLPPPPVRTWWCAEMIDVKVPVALTEIVENLQAWLDLHPEWLGGFGLAPHALFTASAPLISAAAAIAQRLNLPVTMHLAESDEEMQMFRDATGPLYDFLKTIGRSMEDCGNRTPLSYLMEIAPPDKNWVIAHLNELTENDFKLLGRATKFHIVHCPRSHAYFGRKPFPLERLRALGFNVCLGTDSLASNSNLSLLAEMRGSLDKESALSPLDVLTMATVNGAQALGQGDCLGRIAPGFLADLIGVPFAGGLSGAFDAVISQEKPVSWMLVNGEPIQLG